MSRLALCLLCGGPDTVGHHSTGRDAGDRYLDPAFVAPLCHDHHQLVHDDWHTLSVADGTVNTDTFLHSLALGLARTAVLVGRAAEASGQPLALFLERLAAWLARQAARLAGSLAVLDQYCPGWRAIPDV